MLVGYARISTQVQDLALQLDALRAAGCGKLYEGKASGAQHERPALQAALGDMRQGDTLVVWKLDRLARSIKQLIETVEDLAGRGIGLRSLTEAIDTTSSGGKLVFHLFAALAEFERGVIRERTLAGLQAAQARGRTGGRPRPQGQGPGRRQGDAAGSGDHRARGRQAPGRGGLDPLPPSAQGPYRGPGRLSRSQPMPIKPELRWYYPIDWPQVSHWVRFVRAKGRCQVCGRPHGETVRHLGDGRWWDQEQQAWRDGKGRKLPSPALAGDAAPVRTTRVVLAAAHLDHDPAHCGRKHRNVRALCQRCHLLHDRPEHRRRIRLTLRRRSGLRRPVLRS